MRGAHLPIGAIQLRNFAVSVLCQFKSASEHIEPLVLATDRLLKHYSLLVFHWLAERPRLVEKYFKLQILHLVN